MNDIYEEFIKLKNKRNLVPLARKLSVGEFGIDDDYEKLVDFSLMPEYIDTGFREFIYSIVARNIFFAKTSWIGLNEKYMFTQNFFDKYAKLNSLYEGAALSTSYRVYYDAIIDFVMGRKSEALNAFSSIGYDMEKDLYGWDIGARTCKPIDYLKFNTAKLPFNCGEISSIYSARIKSTFPTVLVTCDSRYFLAFYENIIRSCINKCKENINVHFHIVNITNVCRDLVARINKQDAVGLSITYETSEVSDKAYYASVRFIRLPEFMDFLDDSILVMDADAYFSGSLKPMQTLIENSDVGLFSSRGPWGMVPWRKYWAGCVFVRNNNAGLSFASELSKAHSFLWDESRPNWWIDQNAIYYAVEFSSNEVGLTHFAEFRQLREGGDFFPIKTGENYKIKVLVEFDGK